MWSDPWTADYWPVRKIVYRSAILSFSSLLYFREGSSVSLIYSEIGDRRALEHGLLDIKPPSCQLFIIGKHLFNQNYLGRIYFTIQMTSKFTNPRPLGKHGPLVPAMGFGLMIMTSPSYGTLPEDDQRFALLDRAAELGATFWDTSE